MTKATHSLTIKGACCGLPAITLGQADTKFISVGRCIWCDASRANFPAPVVERRQMKRPA